MLKDIFQNRLFIGALAIFIFCVAGSLLYMNHEMQKGAEEPARDEEQIKQLTEKQQPQPTETEAPIVEQTQQGHFHADGTWHGEPHAPVVSEDVQFSDVDVRFNLDFLDNLPPDVRSRIRIDYDYLSITNEERERRDRESNQELINRMAGDPRYAEVHQIMSENAYPYSPVVEAEIQAAYGRLYQKRIAQAKLASENHAKQDARLADLQREIAIREAQGLVPR